VTTPRFREVTEQLRAVRARKQAVGGDVRSMADRDKLSLDGQARFDRKVETYEKLDREETLLDSEIVALVAGDKSLTRERAFGDGDGPKGRLQHLRRVDDPWAERSFYDGPTELRDAALTVVDRGDQSIDRGSADDTMPIEPEDRARVERLLREDEHGDLAAYVVASSRPSYAAAFNKAMQGRTMLWSDEERAAMVSLDSTRMREESRAALSTTGANGGFLIPFFLDPSVILTNAGTINPYRQICRVVTIPTNVWHGVSSAGVTAEWTSEASEVTDASPTFLQPTITPIRADAYVQASWEVVGDTNIAAQLGLLFADAKANLEGTAFAVGTGSTQPEGIVTRLNVTTASKVSAQTNGSFGLVDCFALVNSLPARAQANARWTGHWGIANLIRQFGIGSTGNSAFWADLGPDVPSLLLGAPFHRVSAMQSSLSAATASSDNILVIGDWSRYLIVDRIGMEVVPAVVYGANRRPTGETGFTAWWRVGSDTTDASQFRLLVA
jgi:HK97 family phage major capsid protein